MKKILTAAAITLSTLLTSSSWAAPVTASERGLVILLNMYTGDKGAFKDAWYKNETQGALLTIAQNTVGAYGKYKVLYRNQAKLSGLIRAIRELNADPKIKVIDMIVYVHGKPEALNLVYEGLGLLHSQGEYLPIQYIANRVKEIGSTKLRALYSDACYSQYHNDEWLGAGFKVSSGAVAMDGNQSRDLGIFLKHWTRGKSFSDSIQRANKELSYPLLDWTLKDGNSRKTRLGNADIKIDSSVK